MNRSIKEILNEQLTKQADLSEKQVSVIKSATELFSEKGFYNTSTRDIATLAQVSEGTVYKHFKTKDELLYAGLLPLYKTVVAPEVVKEFTSELSKSTTLEGFVDIFVDNRIEFIHNNKNIIKIIFGEIMYNSNIQRLLFGLFNETIEPALSKHIQRLKDNHEIEADLPVHTALQLLITNTISIMLPVLLSNIYSESELNENIKITKHLLIKMLK